MFLNYPNNPTGAVVPDGLFERAVGFGREHDVLVVHDASYTETTFDGYVAPSFLETPGAREVGVEIFSLSKGWNMTGWRTAAMVGNADAVAAYWQLKTNIDSGMFEARAAGRGRGARRGAAGGDERHLPAAPRPGVRRPARDRRGGDRRPRARSTSGRPVPDGHTSASYCELVLEESGVVISPGGAYGPNGEGFFRISLTVPDERLAEAVERLRGSLAA